MLTRVRALASLIAVSLMSIAAPAEAQLGRGCSVFNPCNNGFSCQPGVHRCYNSPRQEGQPCSLGFSCGAGLRCVPGNQVCVSANAPAKGPLEPTTMIISNAVAGRMLSDAYTSIPQQCVYNQAGYVAQIRWYKPGTLSYTKLAEAAYKIEQSAKPFKVETITLGTRSCVGRGDGLDNTGVVTIQGGDIARTAAIIALDIGAVGAVVGCYGGVAALTAPTGGAAMVGAVACELVLDVAVTIIASPEIIPDAKELFAVVKPPIDRNERHKEVILYGTVFDPKTRVGTP